MVRSLEFFGVKQRVEEIESEAERHDQSRNRFDHDRSSQFIAGIGISRQQYEQDGRDDQEDCIEHVP